MKTTKSLFETCVAVNGLKERLMSCIWARTQFYYITPAPIYLQMASLVRLF